MSRSTHILKGKYFPAKTRKKYKDRKHFGFTSGTHSHFEITLNPELAERNQYLTDVALFAGKSVERESTTKTYPVKGVDFIKYGYGKGTKKKVKNYKKEID